MALGKLCHELSRSGNPVTLTLQFGDPAMVSITGVTGVCAPPAGMPCTMIPVGLVPIKLLEGDRVLATRQVCLSPPQAGAAQNEYIFQPFVSANTGQVGVTGGRIAPGSCQGLDFPPPDAGAKDGGGDGAAVEGGTAEGGVEAGPAPDAGAADVPVVADAAADAAADTAADAAPDAAPDLASD
jgi:hypothetical protein